MRKIGLLLSLLGGFLIALAVMALIYAPGRLMKTPLNVDTTTRLSGEAAIQTADGLKTFPVKAISYTRANSAKSDGNVIVFDTSSCLVRDEGNVPDCVSNDDPSKRLISASTDDFAANRVSGIAVNDPKYLPADAIKHVGLVNKFPFQAKKQTYPYFDSATGQAQNATYAGSTKIQGLSVQMYKINVADAAVQIAKGVPGKYSDEKTIYVEPLTGAIVQQVEHQVQTTSDGGPVIDLHIAFTGKQVAQSVSDAKSNVSQLNLIRRVVPIVGLAGGVIALAVGLFLQFRRRKNA